MRTLIRHCLLPLCMLAAAPAAVATDTAPTDFSPYEAYLAAKASPLRSQEVVFSCFGQSFKYVNGFLGREALYVKNGLDWRSVATFQARDHGLSMTTELDLRLEKPHGFSELPEVLDINGNPLKAVTHELFRNEAPAQGMYEVAIDLSTMEYQLKNTGRITTKVRPILTEYQGLHRMAGLGTFFPDERVPATANGQRFDPVATRQRIEQGKQWELMLIVRTAETLLPYDTTQMYATANPGEIAIQRRCARALP